MAYNTDENHTCNRCGITPKQAEEQGIGAFVRRGQHQEAKFETSFKLSYDGGVLCARCHKEKSLKSLFDLMDRRDKERERKAV